jgi:RNA polymerase sigma-70 factor (ECF subfamily)
MDARSANRMVPISEEEFFRLYTQNERRVSAYIVSLVPNWADADDLIQETGLRLWSQRERFVRGTNFGAWACTIARFEVATYRKKMKRQRLHYSDQFVDAVAVELDNDDIAARHSALARCIGQLSETNASMLRAYYADDAIDEEVARRFGRSTAALGKAVWRIRKALHGCIQRHLQGA